VSDLKVEDGNAIGAPSGRAFVRKRLPELFAPNLLSYRLGDRRLALVGGYRLGGSDTRHPGYVACHVFNVEVGRLRIIHTEVDEPVARSIQCAVR